MARLAAQEKLGYYPLTKKYAETLVSYFAGQGRLGDFCAGEGEAAAALSQGLGLELVLNELDLQRAFTCQSYNPAFMLNTDYFDVKTPAESYQLFYLNPPYGSEKSESKRTEMAFLSHLHSKKWLQKDGYLVYVIYSHHLTRAVLRHLTSFYRNIDIYHLPEKHLDSYQQIIIVAQYGIGTQTAEQLLDQLNNPVYLEVQAEPIYELPKPLSKERFYFTEQTVSLESVCDILNHNSLLDQRDFQELFYLDEVSFNTVYLRKPQIGQTIFLLTQGLFDGLILKEDERYFSVKSYSSKEAQEIDAPEESETVQIEYRTVSKITKLYEDGSVTVIESNEDKLAFIEEYGSQLLAFYEDTYEPIYKEDFGRYADFVHNFKKCKNHQTYDYDLSQKHVVAAALTRFEKHYSCVVVAEQGYGKTYVGTGILANLSQRFKPGQVTVVICPGTLVEKWEREIKESVPNAFIKVLREEKGRDVLQVTSAFMAESYQHSVAVAIVSYETNKLREGFKPAYWERKQGLGLEIRSYDTGTALWMIHDGQPFAPNDKYLSDQRRWLEHRDTYVDEAPLKKYPMWSEYRSLKKYAKNFQDYTLKDYFNGKIQNYTPISNAKIAVADFIAARYKNRLGLVIIDEIQETAEITADVTVAAMRLASRAKKVLGLTGTIFKGKASSVFYLEHIFNPDIRKAYPLRTGLERWKKDMGVIIETYKKTADMEWASSGVGGRTVRKKPISTEEGAGLDPRLMAVLLSHCIFVSMKDLNQTLPTYTEKVVEIEMSKEQEDVYTTAETFLTQHLQDALEEKDNSFLGKYLQVLLRMPNATFRSEEVNHRIKYKPDKVNTYARGYESEVVYGDEFKYTIPALNPDIFYPKEQWLADYVSEQLKLGRGVTIGVFQTNTRDIRPRLQAVLETIPEAKILVLETGKTDKRENFLQESFKKGTNVLLTNPKLVKVGLDLIETPSIVLYEPMYSLTDTQQFSKRHRRFNQPRYCETSFLYYKGTMEAQAVKLMSDKALAANILYGNLDAEGLAALSGGNADSIYKELKNLILQRK